MTLPDNLFLRFENNRAALGRGELPAPRHEDSLFILISAVVLLLFGSMGVWEGMHHLGAGAALLFDGQDISASINGGGITNNRSKYSNTKSYYVVYVYTAPDGQRHSREAGVSGEEFERFRREPIPARYVRSAPQISRLDTEWPLLYGGAITGVTGLFAGMGLLLGMSWWQDDRKYSRRKRGAKLRFGTLLDVTTREGKDHDLWVTLHYQVDGVDASQSAEWMDNNLRDRLPQPGARLAFAYEADDNLELL